MATCVDLFCGAGGFSIGFHREKFDISAATDIHPDALKTYRHNFPSVDVYEGDITNIAEDIEPFLDSTGVEPSNIDVVIGGPPCKGFSTAGKMDPDDPRNSLIDSYLTVVDKLDPQFVVMENVEGILRLKDGIYADKIVQNLQEQGFSIPGPQKVSAAAHGVPQNRTRVFFIGSKSNGSIALPEPTHNVATDGGHTVAQESIREGPKSRQVVTAQEALDDLAFLGIGEESETYERAPETEYQKEMREGSDTLHNHLSTNHGERVQNRFSMMSPGDSMDDIPEEYQTSKHTQQRLHPDRPSPTVTTLPEDIIHYSIPRIPTVREVARLQSFPDWFEFKSVRTTGGPHRKNRCPQYSQVGNAVPPRLAEAIAGKIAERLN